MERRDFLLRAGLGAVALAVPTAAEASTAQAVPIPKAGTGVAAVWAKSMFSAQVGTIGTSEVFTQSQTITPGRSLLAIPVLRYVNNGSSDAIVDAYISEYVDSQGSHKGKFAGITGTGVTRIVWALKCKNSFTNPLRLIFYFD